MLTEAMGRQAAVEAAAGPGTALLTVTEPTETATAAAFAHTAVLAGKPANGEPLREAGRLFGRIAHLVDAVEDLAADRASGAWNPLLATGADLAEARRLCDDALLGIKLALGEAEFSGRAAWCTRCSCTSSPARCTGCSPARPAPPRRARPHEHASAPLAGCGLPVAGLTGLTGLLSLRHRLLRAAAATAARTAAASAAATAAATRAATPAAAAATAAADVAAGPADRPWSRPRR